MTLSYTLVGSEQGQTLTVVFSDGEVLPISSSHTNFERVLDKVLNDPSVEEADVRGLLDLVGEAGLHLTKLSERVSVAGNSLYFDDEVIDSTLAAHIVRLIENGQEQAWKPFVNFLEKLSTNPSKQSQESLYNWLRQASLTVAEDGDFIAYKGVKADGGSIHEGRAFVDGVEVKGSIPNAPGAVISMARGEVDDNTGAGCSHGLHAGTWSYASGFAQGQVLEVRINPRDVVSVPDDCSFQKLRVSRYTVVKAIDQAYTDTTVFDQTEDNDFDDQEDDEFEVEYCEYCGDELGEGESSDECPCNDEEDEPEEDEEDAPDYLAEPGIDPVTGETYEGEKVDPADEPEEDEADDYQPRHALDELTDVFVKAVGDLLRRNI